MASSDDRRALRAHLDLDGLRRMRVDTLGRGVKTSGEAVYAPIEGYPTRAECEKGRRASSVDEVEQLKRDSQEPE
jgi:hypothetical protein